MAADSKVVELKQFIDAHCLPLKKHTGGPKSRTKAEMYNDILRTVHARSSPSSPGTPEPEINNLSASSAMSYCA